MCFLVCSTDYSGRRWGIWHIINKGLSSSFTELANDAIGTAIGTLAVVGTAIGTAVVGTVTNCTESL